MASGCGILDGDVAVGSGFLPALPCWQPFAVRYNTALRSYDPAVVVLMFGPTLMYDRRLGRNVLRVGSPAFEQYLDDNLDSLRGQLKTQSLRFVVTTVPCMTANHYGTITNLDSVLRDNARRESVNGALRQYATSRHLALLDFDSLLCRGGQRVVLAHRYALGAANGIGLSPAGAGTSWRWLAHQLNLDQPLTPASRPS